MMSLIKTKFNKSKTRRIKLSNRNKIEYLYNQLRKLKAEKSEMKAEKDRVKAENNDLVYEQLQNHVILKDELEKIKDLKKQVECPVCLEVPRKGPVFACPNGHLVCQKCKRENCPTCRGAVGDNKSLVAVAIIEKILHDCKFVQCEEEFALEEIEEHEKHCEHRVVACPYYEECDQRVSLSKLLEHLERKPCGRRRAPIVVNEYVSEIARYEANTRELFESRNGLHWKVATYSHAGYLLALRVNKSANNMWQFIIVMFETPEVCAEFNVEIEVYEADSDPNTRLSAKVHCHPSSIDEASAEMEGLGLCVHHRFMKRMMLKEEYCRFIVSFSFLF